MAEPIALMYFTLDEHRDSGDLRGFNRSEFPELGVGYVTAADARAAGDAVFSRVENLYRQRIRAYDPMREPGAAKRRWDDPSRSACFSETRIIDARVAWEDTSSRWGVEWSGAMTLVTEHRHRWREVEMVTEVAKDGTTTITHRLGKAAPWSPWARGVESGGVYIPQVVRLVVRRAKITLSTEREQLAAWVRGGDRG